MLFNAIGVDKKVFPFFLLFVVLSFIISSACQIDYSLKKLGKIMKDH